MGFDTRMETKIGIINAGAWGTAIAKVVSEKGMDVHVWDHNKTIIPDINKNHTNSRYLLGVDLPECLTAHTDIKKVAEDKPYLLIATPSIYIRDTIKRILDVPTIKKGETIIGIFTKGFVETGNEPLLITQLLEGMLPSCYKDNLVYISGPSHAEEVSRGKLTGLISASRNGKNAIRFRKLLQGSNLVVFSSFDVIGVQVCAAVKNVIAIGCGMFDALKEISNMFGDNTESLLIAAGLNEIQFIGQALGSTYPETFTSIAGVGDLHVTCKSKYGRNRRFGKEVIQDRITDRYKDLDDLIKNISNIGYLPEGVMASKYVKQISTKHDLRLPISDAVYEILNNEVQPLQAVNNMLNRISGNPRNT